MLRLCGRYLLLAAAVVLLNFLLPRLLPGDPLAAGSDETGDAAHLVLPADARARLVATYRLDQPLFGQFVGYLGDLGRFDFGRSITRGASVADLIAARLPWTVGLMSVTALLSAGLGTFLGVLAGWRGGRADAVIVAASTVLAALPELLIALGLLVVFAVGTGWFPLHGAQTPFGDPFGSTAAPFSVVVLLRHAADIVWHLTLPALALVLSTTAAFVLVARGAVRAERGRPYLTVARSKGLSEGRLLRAHLLPNAALPLATLFGLRLGQLLGGAVVVERVFALPGLGLFAYEAIRARDYPVLQAVFLLGSLFVLLTQFGLEVVYRAWVPRHAS